MALVTDSVLSVPFAITLYDRTYALTSERSVHVHVHAGVTACHCSSLKNKKQKKAGFHEMNKSILVHNSSVFPTVALSLSINFQVGAGLGSGL